MKTKRGQHPKSRANLKPFQRGISPNPGGRPRGFVERIKDCCGEDYDRLVTGLYLIAFGTAAERFAFFGEHVKVTTHDRLVAIIELRDSGPGRPRQMFEVDSSPQVPMFIVSSLPSFSPNPNLPVPAITEARNEPHTGS